MNRPSPRLLAPYAFLVLAACGDGADPGDGGLPDEAALVRPVVVPARPLALANPNADAVSWPVWGGAFTLEDTVELGVALSASGAGASGLQIAGPGAWEERLAAELVWTGEAWSLRETAGGEVVQEVEIAAPASAAFRVVVEPDGAIRAAAGEARGALTLGAPLAADGAAAGVYVTLEPGAELAIDDLALSQPLPEAASLGAPLRGLGETMGLSIGTATDVWPPLHDLGFEALLGEQFGTASPTEFYWPTTRGEDEDYFFVPADLMVNYATVHGQQVTGMFLVWDFELPGWLDEAASTGDRDALGLIFDEHITTLVDRYEGRVDAWIVVNEAILGPDENDGGPAEIAYSIFSDVLGPEYIERAFRTARAADPEATLLYNETGAEALNGKSDFLHELVSDLVAREVPIDGVGLQFHLDAAALPDMADVRANLERFAALGLDLYITELDVSLANMTTGTEAEHLELQARVYTDVLEVCLAIEACKSYTVFGFSDRYAWDELGDATPLLFDAAYRPKPAYFAVQAALEAAAAARSR